MARFYSSTVRRHLAVVVCFAVAGFALKAQAPAAKGNLGVTTQQRLESEVWWPTLSTSPPESFAGTTECARCHADVGSGLSAPKTAMARAASRTPNQQLSAGSAENTLESAELRYLLHDTLDGLELTVAHGDEKASQRLDWAMGSGELGRTFVYQKDGRWFQSRISEYRVSPNLDVTTGLTIPKLFNTNDEISLALGKVLTTEEIRHCFSCHTVHATTSRGFNPAHGEAGLGCEACHGPGAAHVKDQAAKPGAHRESIIFNPAKLAPADSIDFCGACHRTFGDVTQSANPANDSSVVRFQPYRLEKSRCWRETEDARLTCVGCHDPHLPLVRDDASYDRRCESCHRSGDATDHGGKVCPTGAKTQCISCHMQKVKVASMHGEFTDHFIRVVKAGEGFQQ